MLGLGDRFAQDVDALGFEALQMGQSGHRVCWSRVARLRLRPASFRGAAHGG
jgi:hypothetical protein